LKIVISLKTLQYISWKVSAMLFIMILSLLQPFYLTSCWNDSAVVSKELSHQY